ncbi:hypothetical protein FMUND_7701 [Fusarium mundagurra]|uniref:Uncharacterized protein n=1 Tax=Fusarium mundagurra TaxID=1567541 RepID=A0A8H5YJS1_9HYPO|nr:hypothetical protein FMUND_7701 [Fusarium mundagurra]
MPRFLRVPFRLCSADDVPAIGNSSNIIFAPWQVTRLDEISGAWSKLLIADDYKNFLLSAYIWAIVESVFTTGRKFCSGGHNINLKAMRAAFLEYASEVDNPSRPGPTLRHVARWFAQGTALFGHFRRDQIAFRREARLEVEGLQRFCNIAADKSGTDFHQEMKSILEAALDLDEMLMSSKAIFLVHWPQDEQPDILQQFDIDKMESLAHTRELSSETMVKFLISPMLIKVGNADGCNYDTSCGKEEQEEWESNCRGMRLVGGTKSVSPRGGIDDAAQYYSFWKGVQIVDRLMEDGALRYVLVGGRSGAKD